MSKPLAVRRRGAGEPLVLLHPLALSGDLWTPLAEALSDEFQVFALDLRGHGDSAWDGKPFTIEDLADDVARTLDTLDLPAASLLGLSMGGSVAVNFAGRHPGRVRSLVLADTTAWYGEDAVTTWAERAQKAVAVPRAKQVTFQLDRWFSPEFLDRHPDEADRVVKIFLRTNSEAHAAASIAMGAMDSRPLLPSVTAPTLVLAGRHDYATPPSMARTLAEGIDGAELEILPGLRHLSLIERPLLAGRVRQHLRRVTETR
ncbi:lactone hydrolase [Amycolatopsis sp. NBRC 101858]|uniref:alpha/beta fold hydrolase n=1 Tax=Amycolatopsis sp. NBRC 101858 TaxID=3032200 RepID=UPI0024A03787|nr:alpha/beta fold hydrolase [Amycolatopsis sp. NBRC 101858]GLY38450.1 lactone hydrolase [Amycolatopsis sp. NBRC 101858]